MSLKQFRTIAVSVSLGCLAASLALAQPVISTQPVNQFRTPGQTAVFSVVATGAAPLTYQWLFDTTAMVDATNRVLSLANPQRAQCGYYSVIVSNPSGSVTSQVAELKVFVAARHSLSGIQARPGGSVNLSFTGETTALFASYYDLYPLECSSNLVDWTTLATLQRSNTALETLDFVDVDAPQFSQRFYRTPTNQLATPLRQPTGPYTVGTFSMLLTNPSRTGTQKQFMVSFWYPAVAQAGVLPAKYEDPQVAVPGNWGSFATQAAAFFSHSLSNAALAPDPAKYPVVLYDPGSSGDRRENVDKTEDLASWGYVMVGLDTKDTYISVFPNGTVVNGQTVDFSTTAGLDAATEGRVQDMQFVLDELESLNANDPRLDGQLDLENIGVLGYSLGGESAAQLCLRDARCKACAGMDWVFVRTNLLTQPPGFPFLFFRSDFGPDPDPAWSIVGWPDGRLEFFNGLVTNAYWVKLASTTHSSFCDAVLVLDPASLEAGWGWPMSGQLLPPARVSQVLRSYLLSFFNKFLKGEDDHLLDGASPAYPEVVQFLSKSASSATPEYPSAALVQGSDGNFYGTTAYGGASGDGTVFRVITNGTMATLISFNGTNGSHPVAALVQGSDGNFYGTTEFGGTNGNRGTVFQMTAAGVLTTLVSFNGTNGSHPAAALVQGNDGNLYGTTILGGAYNHGTIYRLTPGGALTTLVSFTGGRGNSPFGALVEGTNGSLYGTTLGGCGAWFNSVSSGYNFGTVFTLTPAGLLTTPVWFSGANGYNPSSGLVQGSDGNFYGTTAYGGNTSVNGGSGSGCGLGTVFKMTPAGVLTTLISFNGANGSYCVSGLVQGSDGNFYGTTAGGGAGGSVTGGGTVFRVTPSGALTTLVSFNGANGSSPQAPLIQASDGNFYGTTTYGGPHGGGTVFQVTTNGVLTTLVAFGRQTNSLRLHANEIFLKDSRL